MLSKINTEQAHSEIGQALHDAKRRLLDAHSRGVPLRVAGETFLAEAESVLTRVDVRLYGDLLSACAAADKPLSPAPHAHEDSENDSHEEPDLLETLGLDNASIDAIAEQYKAAGDDDYLNLTLALLERISKLCKAAPPRISLEDYIATVIARLFRATYYVELTSVSYAETADEKLRIVKGGEA